MFPQLLKLGSFALPTYGFLVAIGVVSGLLIASKLAQREGEDPDKAWNLGIIAILAAIIGAKLLLIVNDWEYYSRHLSEIFSLTMLQAGGVFYGGLLAAIAASVWYIRRNRMPVLKTCDAFAPGIALGHAIGRVGCFAAGCCYGKPTTKPWGVVFTNPIANQISGTPLGVHIHPTQLYEAAIELINFALLFWLFRNKRFHGQVIGAYMFLYGFARYFIEFLRDDPERGMLFGGALTTTQLISICLVVAGAAIWLWKGRQATPQLQPASDVPYSKRVARKAVPTHKG